MARGSKNIYGIDLTFGNGVESAFIRERFLSKGHDTVEFHPFVLQTLLAGPAPHRHEYFEAHYILSGRGACVFHPGGRALLRPGSFITVFPGERHHFEGFAGEDPFTQFFFGFRPEESDGPFAEELRRLTPRRKVYEVGQARLGFFHRLGFLAGQGALLRRRLACEHLKVFYYELLDKGALWDGRQNVHPVAAELLRELMVSVQGRFSLRAYARSKAIDPARLTRVFKTSFGQGPARAFQSLKLEAALEYLRNRDATLEDAAMAFCYSSAFHLSRQCKKWKGVSPRGLLRL
jgi:AraC-like DNA-binding protein